ncbi:transposase [Candidatus Magnetomoraceae bacterium gMMP-13]
MEFKNHTVFEKILEPFMCLLDQQVKNLDGDDQKYKLSLKPFTLNLLFGIINGIKSVSLLITNIKTSKDAKRLGLVDASKSMYSEAFGRYNPSIFQNFLYKLLENLNFLEIPEIKALGRFACIDGSIFPAIKTMTWASYKSTSNAIKLHLLLELNRMVPLQFISTEAKFSERKALLNMLETGVTFITNRGYVSFALFYEICQKGSHFIIRSKSNLIYEIVESLYVSIPETCSPFIKQVKNLKIVFTNDKHNGFYRFVSFVAMGETFALITDRFDLKTYEIIILYAYRWQIELMFRFLKRTLNGLHLMCHSPDGIKIQFTLFLIAYLLLLSFKQQCVLTEKTDNEVNDELSYSPLQPKSDKHYKCGLVSLLGERLQKYWKIGIHWLTTIQNLLMEAFTPKILKLIRLMQ